MKTAVIISTYNSPIWLEKVLWGYENQTDLNFEIIIADDGSNADTKAFLESYKKISDLKISHVWHEDNGFQKTVILNKAILSTQCDYLIFTDGDCIPRWDFVEIHKRRSKVGHYLSAGYFKLSMKVSKHISRKNIDSKQAFNYEWLVDKGQPKTYKSLKLSCKRDSLLNFLTPTRATWNGANSSAFRKDILSVNGFDERMQYGGEDVEMGERMTNMGIKGIQIRYSAICIHLDHQRGYVNPEAWKRNDLIRKGVAQKNLSWTEFGIIKEFHT